MRPRKQKPQTTLTAMPVKCAQCSMRIEAGDLVVFMHGDLFHRACWRIVVSNVRMEESATMRRASRDLIAEARQRLARQQRDRQQRKDGR